MTPPQQRDFTALSRKASRLRAAPVEADSVTPPEPAEADQRRPGPTEREADESSPRRVGRPSSGRQSKGIGLPGDLVEQMMTVAEKAGLSYGDWLIAVFNDVYDALAQEYPPLPQYRPEIPPPRRPPRRRVSRRQAVNFRLTPAQLAAIDKRQNELAVESRSEFVTTIVQLGIERA